MFSSLSIEPVASASLGQVYKGRLRDMYGGGEVAVKVQRPHVQASVALDLLLMRRFAAFSQTFPQVRLKSPALVVCMEDCLLQWPWLLQRHWYVVHCSRYCLGSVDKNRILAFKCVDPNIETVKDGVALLVNAAPAALCFVSVLLLLLLSHVAQHSTKQVVRSWSIRSSRSASSVAMRQCKLTSK